MTEYHIYDFKVDQRVQTHPDTMWWSKGARYGTVTRIGRKLIYVQLDNVPGRPKRFTPGNLIPLDKTDETKGDDK